MVLIDHIRRTAFNTLLATVLFAYPASDTSVCDMKPFFFQSVTAKREALSVNRLFSEIEKFQLPVVHAKRLEDVSAFPRVNVIHGRVFFKDTVDPLFLL